MMQLRQYLAGFESAKAKSAFADRLGVSYHYLRQIAGNTRQAGPDLCAAIERESRGAVRRHEVRPDLFGGSFVAGLNQDVTLPNGFVMISIDELVRLRAIAEQFDGEQK